MTGTVNLFSSFAFYRLQSKFRHMPNNEQMAAKQAFENAFSSQQERTFLRAYMTSALNASSDIVLWRISHSIKKLQELSASLLKNGIGAYLKPVQVYIGMFSISAVSPENAEAKVNQTIGLLPYMSLQSVEKNKAWHILSPAEKDSLIAERASVLDKYKTLSENVFYSCGIDNQDLIIQRESKSAAELTVAALELQRLKDSEYNLSSKPYYFCIGRSLTEILDYLA